MIDRLKWVVGTLLLLAMGVPSTAAGIRSMSAAEHLVDSGRSVTELRSLIERHPDSLALHQQYIKLVGLEDPGLEATYRAWSGRFPKLATVPFALGDAMASGYDYRAKNWLLQAVALDPQLAEAWADLSMDAERWGDEPLASEYMGRASSAEPENPNYAFYYASSLKTVRPEEYRSAMLGVVKRFPSTERAAQALYWLAHRTKDVQEKEALYQRSKSEFSPAKFRWSASSMRDYFGLLLKQSPAKAVALAEEMSQQLAEDESWKGNLAIAQRVNDARNFLSSGEAASARDLMLQPIKGRLYGLEETLVLLTVDALHAAGDTKHAFDSVLNFYTRNPTYAGKAKLEEVGRQLGLTDADITMQVHGRLRAIAEPATAFDLARYSGPGERLRLKDLEGYVVLVTYWFPGCGPCRGEFPHFEHVLSKFDRDQVSYVGINISPKEDPYVLPFMKASGHSFTPVKDDPDKRGNLTARGAPTNYLIDRKGNILYRNFMIGDNNQEVLELMISHALEME